MTLDVELSPETWLLLQGLLAMTNATDTAALLQRALAVYKWTLDTQAAGHCIIVRRVGGALSALEQNDHMKG